MARPKVGTKYFGKIPATIEGYDAFASHDGKQTWDDGNAAHDFLLKCAEDMKGIIADQVRDGVAEYSSKSQFAIRSDGKDLMIGLRLDNHIAPMILEVSLSDLINAGLEEAYKTIASQPSQDLLTGLASLGRAIAQVTQALPQTPTAQARQSPLKRAGLRQAAPMTNGAHADA
jgi:hypothetical protein